MSDSENDPGSELQSESETKRGRGRPRGPNYHPKPQLEEGYVNNVKRGRGRPKGSFKNKKKSGSGPGECSKIHSNKNATSAMQSGDVVPVPPPAKDEDELQIPETAVTETGDDDDNRSVELPYSERDGERMNFSLCASGSSAATDYNDMTRTSIETPKRSVGAQVNIRGKKSSQFPEPIQTELGRYTLVLDERHQKQAAYVKTRQWCWTCEKRSIFRCCWNTSYCSRECQKIHWNEHKYKCTRP